MPGISCPLFYDVCKLYRSLLAASPALKGHRFELLAVITWAKEYWQDDDFGYGNLCQLTQLRESAMGLTYAVKGYSMPSTIRFTRNSRLRFDLLTANLRRSTHLPNLQSVTHHISYFSTVQPFCIPAQLHSELVQLHFDFSSLNQIAFSLPHLPLFSVSSSILPRFSFTPISLLPQLSFTSIPLPLQHYT